MSYQMKPKPVLVAVVVSGMFVAGAGSLPPRYLAFLLQPNSIFDWLLVATLTAIYGGALIRGARVAVARCTGRKMIPARLSERHFAVSLFALVGVYATVLAYEAVFPLGIHHVSKPTDVPLIQYAMQSIWFAGLIACCEEVGIRGVALPVIESIYGAQVALWGSTLLFVIGHTIQLFASPASILIYTCSGILLGRLAQLTRSVTLPIAVHALADLAIWTTSPWTSAQAGPQRAVVGVASLVIASISVAAAVSQSRTDAGQT